VTEASEVAARQTWRFDCPAVPPGESGARLVSELQEFLEQTGYTERAINARLGMEEELLEFECIMEDPGRFQGDDIVAVLMRLFLRGESFEEGAIPPSLPEPAREMLRALGLLVQHPDLGGRWCASCALYPTRGMYLASDRWYSPDNSPFYELPDIVFPGCCVVTHGYMNSLPRRPCKAFLELCSGTGVAAIFAAKNFARESWAVDIGPRCTEYAEFNRRLNATLNVTALTGDMYQPVRGLRFDFIAAHPPYVPSLAQAAQYADGGPDGEQLTRRVIAGLPEFLAPGGVCYCMTLGTHRKDAPFEERVRRWLGEAHDEFDVAFFQRRRIPLTEFAFDDAVKHRSGKARVEAWTKLFEQQQVEEMVLGLVVVERRTAPGKAFTARRYVGDFTTREEIEWQLVLERRAAGDGFPAELRAARMSAARDLNLLMQYRLEAGSLVPRDLRLEIEFPFLARSVVPPWVAAMLSFCDGSITPARLLQVCREKGLLQVEVPEAEFLLFLKKLVLDGFLEMDSLPHPPRKERSKSHTISKSP
jgi:SAM-dependent methyltransferase